MTTDPNKELRARYWQTTEDFPKVGSLWIRGKGDYREHMVIGYANSVAFITASCGCMPILESSHIQDWRLENMEWSENRRDWFDCTIDANTRAPAESEAAALREALKEIEELADRESDVDDGIPNLAMKIWKIAENAQASTVGTDLLERLDAAIAERDAALRDASNERLRIVKLEGLLSETQKERDALQHIIDCAKTPLMRDVMSERDHLRQLIATAPHAEGCPIAHDPCATQCECWKARAEDGR